MPTTGKTPSTLPPRNTDELRREVPVRDPKRISDPNAAFEEARNRVARSDSEYSDAPDTPPRPAKGPASEQYAARLHNLDGFLNKLRNG